MRRRCAPCNRYGQRGVLSADDRDQAQKFVVIDEGLGDFRREFPHSRWSSFNPSGCVHNQSCCSFEIIGYYTLFYQSHLVPRPVGMDDCWRRDAIRALTHTSPRNPQTKHVEKRVSFLICWPSG